MNLRLRVLRRIREFEVTQIGLQDVRWCATSLGSGPAAGATRRP